VYNQGVNILNLAFQVGISKKLRRTGWVMRNVKDPESVADHCFRVVVLSMALAPMFEVDREKLTKMAIIHDLGETSTGDLVVEKGRTVNIKLRKEKENIEKQAIRNILYGFGEDYSKLFQEMIDRKTKEAIIFWEIDVLERTIQAYEYEKEQGVDMSEFFDNADEKIKNPVLRKSLSELIKMRKDRNMP